MANVTMAQIKKMNAAMADGWSVDFQRLVLWNEKTAERRTEPDENGVIYEASLHYIDERTGEGWSAKTTGNKLVELTVKKLTPAKSNRPEDECAMYEVNYLMDKTIGEPKTKKMFNYIQKLTYEIDFNEVIKEAIGGQDTAEEAPEPVEVDENSAIIEGMKFEDASGDVYTITKLDSMQVEFNSGARSLYDFGTSRTVGAVLHGLGNGAHLISAPQDTQTDTKTDEATTGEEEPETTPETATEDAQTEETETSEEEPTADTETAQTDEEQPTTAPEAENNKPDYSALAAAYFTGKTIKATKKPKKAPQEETTPEPEPTATEEEPKKESHPLKTEYGYTGTASDKFTAEEIQTLTDGGQVANKDQYSRNAIFFTTPYSDRTRLVYYVAGATRPTPGNDPKYCGFITDGVYYQHTSAIKDELNADINAAILQTVTSEADAQTKAEEQERGSWGEYNLRTAEELKTREYNDSAQRYFYGNEEPELITNNRYNDQSEAEIIKYIESPAEAVKNQAQTWTDTRAIEIYKAYIIYNRTAPLYYDILSNKDNIEHRIKRMSATVAEEKTLRIELTHGSIIKVDAESIKYLGNRNGKIYNYDILEDTKQDIQRTDYGRNESITADQIKAIYHGQRTLYRAATDRPTAPQQTADSPRGQSRTAKAI